MKSWSEASEGNSENVESMLRHLKEKQEHLSMKSISSMTLLLKWVTTTPYLRTFVRVWLILKARALLSWLSHSNICQEAVATSIWVYSITMEGTSSRETNSLWMKNITSREAWNWLTSWEDGWNMSRMYSPSTLSMSTPTRDIFHLVGLLSTLTSGVLTIELLPLE